MPTPYVTRSPITGLKATLAGRELPKPVLTGEFGLRTQSQH